MSLVARRASWGFVDQVLSSVSNFALSAFVAATVSAPAFGAFTVVYGIYNFALGFSGGLASVPLVVRYSAAGRDAFGRACRASVGTALVVGILAGMVCFAAAPFTTAAVAGPLRALGATLPGLLLQDAWRYSFVADARPARAAANDTLWIVLQLIGIGALLVVNDVSALTMVLVWGGSGTVAALIGCWQARALPQPRHVVGWLRHQRAITWRYAAEAVVHRSGTWLVLALVGAVAGLRAVGGLRGAMLLLAGPLNLLFMGASFAFLSEGVRLLHRSPGRFEPAIRVLTAAGTTIAGAWCLLVLVLAEPIGSRVLGATWPQAKPLILPLIIMMVALGALVGPAQGMLALGAARRSLFTQLAGLTLQLPLVVAAAAADGAPGAALAFSFSDVVLALVAWLQFTRALTERIGPRSLSAQDPATPPTLAGRR